MDIKSQKTQSLRGAITVPGDKSISHRAIILGAIANGITEVTGFLESEDCIATTEAFRNMGVNIKKLSNNNLLIQGVGMRGLRKPTHPIYCGNSGTSMRLLAGLLSAQNFNSQLMGDKSLTQRPMDRIKLPLVEMGAKLETTEGKAPISICGNQILKGITYAMPHASAQIKSGILLASLYATGQTTIIENQPTRNHTELMLQAFGCNVKNTDGKITIAAPKQFQGINLSVPGDISSAAFFIVAASIIPDAELLIKGVGINPTRTGIIDILQQMGACIQIQNKCQYGNEIVADLFIKSAKLHGIEIPKSLIPSAIDEFPIILIAAAYAQGYTTLRGAAELRVKESDRIDAMAEGLTRLGINVETFPDGLCVKGGILQGGTVDSKQDHRIAMAFTIAGLISSEPIVIKDCEQIATSFPNFIELTQQLRLNVAQIGCNQNA